ncbi:MAG TPA: glycosyltransferase 87 family protein, partial [Pilimelia sp.]|nr:glycosyltransferase 87 family protein [Pilimelia sp.]
MAEPVRPRPGRQTAGPVALVAALFAAALAFAAAFSVRHGFFDLRVYRGAMRYWVLDGGELYDFLLGSSPYGFTYPPFAGLLMVPLAYLPWHAAIAVHAAATVACLLAVLWWLVAPLARRRGRRPWVAVGVAAALAAAFEPVRETLLFGQVNAFMLALVAADVCLLLARGSRWAGVGIGLATAVKLTPGIFLLYLLVTGRWRAALTAVGAAAGATLLAGAVAPDASREFWTSAVWNTSRVGALDYVSNQSLLGVLARIEPARPDRLLWLVLVAVVLAVWAWRARAAVARGDELAGFALTGVVGCLVSPVTWVHHLVWLLPALVLLADAGLRARPGAPRAGLLAAAALGYAVLCSRLVWWWEKRAFDAGAFLGANAYVW